MASKTTVVKAIAALSVYFPEREITKAVHEAYHLALSDLTDEQLERAVVEAARTLKWFPKVAELREIAAGQAVQCAGVTTAAEAIEKIYEQIRVIGSYGNPTFTDPLLTRVVVAMGGWRALCLSENPMADRAHMIKLYGEISGAARHEHQAGAPPRLLFEEPRRALIHPGTGERLE